MVFRAMVHFLLKELGAIIFNVVGLPVSALYRELQNPF